MKHYVTIMLNVLNNKKVISKSLTKGRGSHNIFTVVYSEPHPHLNQIILLLSLTFYPCPLLTCTQTLQIHWSAPRIMTRLLQASKIYTHKHARRYNIMHMDATLTPGLILIFIACYCSLQALLGIVVLTAMQSVTQRMVPIEWLWVCLCCEICICLHYVVLKTY